MYIHASCVLGQRVLSGMVLPTIWEKVQGQQQQLSMLVTHTIGVIAGIKLLNQAVWQIFNGLAILCLALLTIMAL